MRTVESILRKANGNMDIADARAQWLNYRRENGYKHYADFLSHEGNAKLDKGEVRIWGLSLLPAGASGYNVCPFATEGCAAACVLMTAGRGGLQKVRDARKVKTLFAAEHPDAFLTILKHELGKISGTGDIVRLNVASDIRWEYLLPMAEWDIAFYDYTKWPTAKRQTPSNYRIVYSRNERDGDQPAIDYLREGGNVAIVFAEMPETWNGFRVIDGDGHDDRTSEPEGVVIGLKAKGDAKSDMTGFVVR